MSSLPPAPGPAAARRPRLATAIVVGALLALGLLVVRWSHAKAWPQVAWPDEAIYLTGARNLVERGSLHTQFYLTYSILRRGHPHRDVHMPGYVLALAPFVARWGATYEAGAALNALLFLASVPLVYALALGVLGARAPATAAAALFTVLPPFPGYLGVVYPEHAVAFVLLAALATAAHADRAATAAVAGVLFGLGPVFRESLLAAAPLFAALLPRPLLLRAFAPAATATLLLVAAPLSRDRAVHPNALFPSLLEEAVRSGAPVATLAGAVARNVVTNVRLTLAADPTARAEDALLALVLVLAAAAAASARWAPSVRARRFAKASLASLALLTFAVFTLYVVRERGGVWGGVRAYMPWSPALLVAAMPLLFALRRPARIAAAAAALAAAFLALDTWQVRFFNRYKATDHEDQSRNAEYLARHIDRFRPTRIVSRSFLYGFARYPVEVVWSLPRDGAELAALNAALPYEFLAIHEGHPLRLVLVRNPRYVRVNKEDRGAEFLIFRRLY